ncbi:MAG: glycosyltransferase family 4 protein [Pseudomonadales bacterium]|nr:glycosyltransferase family 4 protein [Pseudomonadales bacterium]
MKIMLFNNSHLPLIGGKEIVVHQLAMSFMELGHETVVVGPGGYRRFRKFNYPYRLFRWPTIPLVSNELIWQALLILARMRFRCDIIHAHTTYPNGYTAAKLKKIITCPLVITPHGADIHKVPEIGFGHRLDPVKDKKIRYALGIADHATAISESVASSLEDAGLEKSKITLIPNGVDKLRFTASVDLDAYDYLGIPRDSSLIVSVGNYHIRKGHEVLVAGFTKALESDEKLRLVIVGAKSEVFCKKIEDAGMGKYIKFTGALDFPLPGQEDKTDVLVALLQASKAYVSSSIAEGTEGLSLALLEAMSSGACIIATNVSGNRDIIIDGQNGLLIAPESPEEMTDAIVRVVTDRPMGERLSAEGQRSVEPYSWLSIAKLYVSLFERELEST